MKTNIFKQSQTNEMFSTHLALGSFGVGTLLLVLYLLFPREDNLLIMGFSMSCLPLLPTESFS